ncbi:MAG: hypothetical protein COV30_01580 [Candidatus Yanofskybacteria bacterium CG10_big_fil_rev_8_21_14_0_10_37_15]|uniref:Uncharacterized protein n=1 Tax=Candidatus Yanofskybacteria bacterium CG10_big_fil_rev_8_21_14_0_10_37_15 TaxID=1975097 RepID=A0A2H0R5R3_9BACT|nr:MAG: hypothetical protein COV30_01580 [Candidatus Yanofskybacteria bacterium CG10_big_fil_rev_8_21_14_0_10_37_15]
MRFLEHFPKDDNGLYIIYELYSFDNFFRLLLKNKLDHEEAMDFMVSDCSFSALVFQERIHNKKYLKLSVKDTLPSELAASKAKLIYDTLN